jgi:hypothetical protein
MLTRHINLLIADLSPQSVGLDLRDRMTSVAVQLVAEITMATL